MDADKGHDLYVFLHPRPNILNCSFIPDNSYAVRSIVSSVSYMGPTRVMLCTVLGVLLGLYTYRQYKKRLTLPPGPWALPVIGWVGDLSNLATTATIMQKKYGKIFKLKLGANNFVFLTSSNFIKEALHNTKIQGRTEFITFKTVTRYRNIGLINSEGKPWHIGRKFAMRRLGILGLNKSNMQNYIKYEADKLVEHFESLEGEPVVIGPVLNVAILNIIWQLVANRRYDINDPEIKEFVGLMDGMVDIFEGPINLLNLLPWLRKCLPRFILGWLDLTALEDSTAKLFSFTKREIQRHEQRYDGEPQDYIDHYLKQMYEEQADPNSHFAMDQMDLSSSIIDLFFAGSETTSSSLKWFLIFMAQNQVLQQEIRESIDLVVPRTETPWLDHREKLPYLQAAIYETLRLSSFVPQGLPHVATEQTKVGGYDIPKGTILAPCLEVCHKDPNYWERPNNFFPKHFINSEGELFTREAFMPFSTGARRCLGEQLAKMELFLMSATILQQFTVEKGPTFDNIIKEKKKLSNLFNMPPKVDLILKKREL